MELNINDYRINKPIVIRLYKEGGIDSVTFLCSSMGIPCVAAYSYVLEEFEDAEMEKRLESVIAFYGYDSVVGREIGKYK